MSFCCEQVIVRGMNFHRSRPCGCVSKAVRDGKPYCGRHDPVAKAERSAKLAPQKAKTQKRGMALYLAGLRYKADLKERQAHLRHA